LQPITTGRAAEPSGLSLPGAEAEALARGNTGQKRLKMIPLLSDSDQTQNL